MSQSVSVSLTITLKVYDARAFRLAACNQAIEEGMNLQDARQYLRPSLKSLGECAGMIFDPGVGPAGSDIISSDWEG